MLQQFSWTQFLLTSSLLSLIWYAGVLMTAYRTEFFSFFQSRSLGSAEQPIPIDTGEELAGEIEHDLMGPSKLPEGMEKVSMSTVAFAPGTGNADSLDRFHDDQIGLIPDLIWELKEIFELMAKQDGNKADFLRLIHMLSEKYGRIASNPNISQVNNFIRDHAPFALSLAELEDLWS